MKRLALVTLSRLSAISGRSQYPCSTLSKNDAWKVHLLLAWSAPYKNKQNQRADDTSKSPFERNQYESPDKAIACLWETVKQCNSFTGNPPCAEAQKVIRSHLVMMQIRDIQPPCEAVAAAEAIRVKSKSRLLRGRLCLFSVMRGGPLGCLDAEKKTLTEQFRSPTDRDARNPHWYGEATSFWYEARYAPMLPWIESLPARSTDRHFEQARRFAIALHRGDRDAMTRELIRGYTLVYNEIGWTLHHFPDEDWEGRIRAAKIPEARKKALIEQLKTGRQNTFLKSTLKIIDDHFCRASPQLSPG